MSGFNAHTIRGNDRLAAALKGHTRKHQALVHVLDAGVGVECWGTFWDSGSRSHYEHLLTNGSTRPIAAPSAPPEFGGGDAPTVKPLDFGAILKTGSFRGKPATVVLYLTRENAERFGVAL